MTVAPTVKCFHGIVSKKRVNCRTQSKSLLFQLNCVKGAAVSHINIGSITHEYNYLLTKYARKRVPSMLHIHIASQWQVESQCLFSGNNHDLAQLS